MDWKLEVVPIPVSDVDRAKSFYSKQAGFVVDLDTQIGDGMRLVQLTPPGSGCSMTMNSSNSSRRIFLNATLTQEGSGGTPPRPK